MRQNWISSHHFEYLNIYMEKNTLQLSETKAVESGLVIVTQTDV